MNRAFRFVTVLVALAASSSLSLAADDIPSAKVVLPWSDFKTLWEKGQAPKDPPIVAPRDYAIGRATYTGVVQGESTVFTLKMKIDVLKDKGWIAAPLLPVSVALRQARLDGEEAPIYVDNGWYNLITKEKGTLELTLEFAVTTWENGGQNGFSFTMPWASGSEFTLDVPSDKILEFEVSGAQRKTVEGTGTRQVLRASVPPAGSLSISWRRKAVEETAAAADLKPRLYAEHQALVGVSEGLLVCTSAIHYSILHSGIDKLMVNLPEDVTVLDVRGNGIQDWTAAASGGRNRIAVDLGFEAKGSYSLFVDYERPLPDGSSTVVVPDLQVEGVERVKGWVGIDARSNLEVAPGKATEATGVDVRELPTAILGQTKWPVLLGFKYRKPSFSIPLEIRQHQDVPMLVTIIDSASATTVMTPDGRRMTQVVYAMRNNQAQFLRLKVPEGAEVWSTFVGGKAVKPARQDDGRLIIPLARSQTAGGSLAQFSVEMVYVETGPAPDAKGKGTLTANLPIADVPTTVYDWTVYMPQKAKVKSKKIVSTLHNVQTFTSVSQQGFATPQEEVAQVQRQANQVFDKDAAAAGVQPVKVTLPIDGWPLYFEKLLVLDEALTVEIPYKGVK